MRLTVDQLAPFGPDGGLVHFVDTAFFDKDPAKVGVAVSGGGDSMALLHVAKCRADLAGTSLEAVTVDHGLRPEAANEAALVADFCAEHDIPHTTLTWDGSNAEGNVAAAARDARYLLIANWAKSRGIGGVLVGHTADDVAETFLMRLARKSGVDGLALMDVRFDRHGVSWARPFWQQSRAELRDYLRRHDVPWVDDPTNDDESHDRPKARKALAALAPLGITADGLKTVALNMTSARTALEHYAFEESRRVVRTEAGDIVIPLRPSPPIPEDIKRRLWTAAVWSFGGGPYPPRHSAMMELDHGLLMTGKHTLAGCMVTQKDGEVRFSREPAACEGDVDFPAKANSQIWDGRWRIRRLDDCIETGALTIRALGKALSEVPDWAATGLSKSTLKVTPAIFDGDRLVAAPSAGLQNGFEARIVAGLSSFLLSR